jgi:hypothetical protein
MDMRPVQGRFTDRDWARLTKLAQRLSTEGRKAREANSSITWERLTNSSLVRVAVKLLFDVDGEIHGNTEEELLASARQALTNKAQTQLAKDAERTSQP